MKLQTRIHPYMKDLYIALKYIHISLFKCNIRNKTFPWVPFLHLAFLPLLSFPVVAFFPHPCFPFLALAPVLALSSPLFGLASLAFPRFLSPLCQGTLSLLCVMAHSPVRLVPACVNRLVDIKINFSFIYNF